MSDLCYNEPYENDVNPRNKLGSESVWWLDAVSCLSQTETVSTEFSSIVFKMFTQSTL